MFSRVYGLPHRPSSNEREYPRISYRKFPSPSFGLPYRSATTASRSTHAITFRECSRTVRREAPTKNQN